MTRLWTSGAESNDKTVEQVTLTGTISTTSVRTGTYAYAFAGNAGNKNASFAFTATNGRAYFARAYVLFDAVPSAAVAVIQFDQNGTQQAECRVSSSGAFQLWNAITPGQVGSDGPTVVANRWYRVELKEIQNTGGNDTAELYVDGVLVATSAAQAMTNNLPTSVTIGWFNDAIGQAGLNVYIDDVCLNDDQGASQNTYPGDGNVVLLLPTSDNSAGSWRAGSAASAAANGALFDGINNTPPIGTVSPDAVTACISNAISGATNPNGDFNMQTYISKGIQSNDRINCTQMGIVHGEDVSTNTKTGTFNMQSNPNHATDNVSQGGSNQFGPSAGGAVGTYPTNWVAQWGTVFYGDAVTVATAPVARITKVDTGTRAADCCFMGLLVDYSLGLPEVVMAPFRAP